MLSTADSVGQGPADIHIYIYIYIPMHTVYTYSHYAYTSREMQWGAVINWREHILTQLMICNTSSQSEARTYSVLIPCLNTLF